MNYKIWSYLGYTILGSLIFVIGFWFGLKYDTNTSSNLTQTTYGISVSASSSANIVATEVPGIMWIKAGEDNTKCPVDHPIKGKFDSYTGYYYMPDQKSYKNVKAVVCFATEDYAKNSAGFLRKY